LPSSAAQKVSDKIPVINAFIDRKVDKILIGGAMAYTFFKAQGFTVGKSLVENEMMPTALEIMKRAEAEGVNYSCQPITRSSTATNQSKATRLLPRLFR